DRHRLAPTQPPARAAGDARRPDAARFRRQPCRGTARGRQAVLGGLTGRRGRPPERQPLDPGPRGADMLASEAGRALRPAIQGGRMSDTTPPGAPPPPASAGEGAVPRPGCLGRLRRRLVAFERWDRRLLALIVGVGGAFLLYLVIAGWWVHTIDDDPTFTAPAPVENGSQTVDMAEALILRE